MGLRVRSPYCEGVSSWYKGNLHTHTTNSDGTRDPQAVVDAYAARGYGFLMISDHDCLTDPSGLDGRGMCLIPGNEVSALGPHLLHVNARSFVSPDADRQQVIRAVAGDGAFAVLCHPNWEKSFAHCPQHLLETWEGYLGIEVYNGVIRRLDGSPLATDRWDRLLGLGRQVWGFANDDCHKPEDDGLAWNVVQCERLTVEAVAAALREGRFYASTGVTITGISVEGRTIVVRTKDAERIVVHTDFGHHAAAIDRTEAVYTVPEDARMSYVRFQCWGRGEQMAWTQPFFLERE